MNIKALSQIKHDRVLYKAGDVLDVDKKTGDFLISEGVAESTDAKPTKDKEVLPKSAFMEKKDKEAEAEKALADKSKK